MNIKTAFAAAAFAVMPVLASSAVIPITDGGTTNINGKNDDLFVFNVDTDAGTNPTQDFEHTFVLNANGAGTAETSLTVTLANLFTGLMAEWIDTVTNTVLASTTPDADGDMILSTVFGDPDTLSQTLRISFTDAGGAPDFDGQVQVSVVPLPAGVLLMGTALGGLAVARRRKKAS